MKLSNVFDVIGYVTIISYCWEIILQQFPNMYWFQWVAFLILYCAAFFGVLVIVSNYLSEIDKISHKSKLLLRLRYAIGGGTLFALFSMYDMKMFVERPILNWLIAFFGIWSFIWGPDCFGRIANKFTIHGQEREFLVPVEHPQNQSDIWPFHLAMVGVLIMPWIVKMLH